MRTSLEAIFGAVVGIVIGVAMIYALMALADYIARW